MAETLYARSSQIIKTINKYNERENSIEDRKELTKELNSYDFTGLTFWNVNFSNLDLRFKDFSYSNFQILKPYKRIKWHSQQSALWLY